MVRASRSRPRRSSVHVDGNVRQPPLRITRWALHLIRSQRRWALFFFLLLHHGPAGEPTVSNYTSPSPPPFSPLGFNSVFRHLLHVLPPRVSNLLPSKHWKTPQIRGEWIQYLAHMKSCTASILLLLSHNHEYNLKLLGEHIFKAQWNSALPYVKYQICFVISVPASLEDGSAVFFFSFLL